MPTSRYSLDSRSFLRFIPLAVLFSLFLGPGALWAQQSEVFDEYKVRIDAFWFYSNPSGSIHGSGGTDVPVDIQRSLGFGTYPIFAGRVDRKLSHKNHLYLVISPLWTSHQITLSRTITFQGETFEAGSPSI